MFSKSSTPDPPASGFAAMSLNNEPTPPAKQKQSATLASPLFQPPLSQPSPFYSSASSSKASAPSVLANLGQNKFTGFGTPLPAKGQIASKDDARPSGSPALGLFSSSSGLFGAPKQTSQSAQSLQSPLSAEKSTIFSTDPSANAPIQAPQHDAKAMDKQSLFGSAFSSPGPSSVPQVGTFGSPRGSSSTSNPGKDQVFASQKGQPPRKSAFAIAAPTPFGSSVPSTSSKSDIKSGETIGSSSRSTVISSPFSLPEGTPLFGSSVSSTPPKPAANSGGIFGSSSQSTVTPSPFSHLKGTSPFVPHQRDHAGADQSSVFGSSTSATAAVSSSSTPKGNTFGTSSPKDAQNGRKNEARPSGFSAFGQASAVSGGLFGAAAHPVQGPNAPPAKQSSGFGTSPSQNPAPTHGETKKVKHSGFGSFATSSPSFSSTSRAEGSSFGSSFGVSSASASRKPPPDPAPRKDQPASSFGGQQGLFRHLSSPSKSSGGGFGSTSQSAGASPTFSTPAASSRGNASKAPAPTLTSNEGKKPSSFSLGTSPAASSASSTTPKSQPKSGGLFGTSSQSVKSSSLFGSGQTSSVKDSKPSAPDFMREELERNAKFSASSASSIAPKSQPKPGGFFGSPLQSADGSSFSSPKPTVTSPWVSPPREEQGSSAQKSQTSNVQSSALGQTWSFGSPASSSASKPIKEASGSASQPIAPSCSPEKSTGPAAKQPAHPTGLFSIGTPLNRGISTSSDAPPLQTPPNGSASAPPASVQPASSNHLNPGARSQSSQLQSLDSKSKTDAQASQISIQPLSPPSTPSNRLSSPPVSSPPAPSPSTIGGLTPVPVRNEAAVPVTHSPALVQSYNIKDEPRPSHPLFTSTFQNAMKDGSRIARDTVSAIAKMSSGGLAGSDLDLNKFLDDAKALQRFQGSDTRTIAVLGDSGEGKSSLINSLLHFPDVAQTGDIGSACTSIVTEYRQKKLFHAAPITIEVEYLSAPAIKELIRELLWSYRQLYLPGVESESTSEADYARYTRESEHAWSALQAAFKHKRQFTQGFAQDMSDGALEKITNQLIQWTKEIQWPVGVREGFWSSTAETAEECVEHTKVFMQDRYWPFTKIIRVYLDSDVLKSGVVLADLPGLQDTNLARVRATQDYLLKCDNILIVAKISRAITDKSLKSSLFYVLSRHVPTEWEQSGAEKFKIAVVCTKSEDINPKTARAEFCGVNKRISPESMKQLDDEIAAAKAAGDRMRKKAAKKRQELLLVQARNQHVKDSLQSVYASEMQGKTLDVFCVSNKWYEKYCPKGNAEFVQASGIPDLRRFCHTITADAQFGEVKNFLLSKMSAHLNSLDLWTSSSMSKRDANAVLDPTKPDIFDCLEENKKEISLLPKTFCKEFLTCFQEQIMTFFTRRDEHWERAASNEGEKWTNWHWSNKNVNFTGKLVTNGMTAQYNAWCHNNGEHQTLKRGHENWNAKIIWKMRMELEGQWDLVEEEAVERFEEFLNQATRIIRGLKQSIKDRVLDERCERADALIKSIDPRMQDLEYRVNREERTFRGKIRAIRRYASEANSTSYILRDMLPVYRSAACQFGTGKNARQIDIVQGHIEEGVVFPQLAIWISTSINDAVAETEKNLAIILCSAMESIKKDVQMLLRAPDGGVLGGRDMERECRLSEFAGELKELKQRHGRVVQSIASL